MKQNNANPLGPTNSGDKNFILQGSLRLTFISSFEELASYAQAWNELAIRAMPGTPMLSHAWISTYFECRLCPEKSWICLLAYDHSRLIGVLPLIISRHHFIGLSWSQLSSPFDWHTVSAEILIEPGRENEVIPLMLSGLRHIKPAFANIQFKRLKESSPIIDAMQKGLNGFAAVPHLNGYGSFIRVTEGYCQYLAGIDMKFLRNLRRVERNLISLGEMEHSHITVDCGNEEYLNRFVKLEASGWKGKNGTAITQSPSLIKFYSTLVARLGKLGWLEWHFLTLNGKDIAAIMALPFGRKLIVLKICYDECVSALSPGSKIFEFMIRDAFESGRFDEIDCLTKYAWNANWHMDSRSYYDLSIYRTRKLIGITPYLFENLLGYCERQSIFRNIHRLLSNKRNH